MSFSKDKQGHWRGKCTVQNCDCGSFLVEDATKVRCDYCDHVPVKHVKVLRSCTSEQCGCSSYDEDDEDDEEGECSYCGHSIKDHPAIIVNQPPPPQAQGRPRMPQETQSQSLPHGQPRQPLSATMGSAAVSMPTGYPPSQSNVGAGVQGMKLCKFPGCKRPCFREGTRVHEFCGRTHASQFAATMTSGSSGQMGPY